MTEQIYEDRWGEVFDRPSADLIELRWFDTTAEMSAGDFQSWLKTFAECVEKCGRSRVSYAGGNADDWTAARKRGAGAVPDRLLWQAPGSARLACRMKRNLLSQIRSKAD